MIKGSPAAASHAGLSAASELPVQNFARSKTRPPFRRLRVYAFDPSLETELENAVVNQLTLKVPWEPDWTSGSTEALLGKGPVGEYLDFVPLPGLYWALLTVTLFCYVLLTQGVKMWLLRRRWI